MSTEQEMNPYQGIEFYVLNNQYQAHFTQGKGTWHIGFFDSLKEAMDARVEFIEKRRNKQLESETETYAQAS